MRQSSETTSSESDKRDPIYTLKWTQNRQTAKQCKLLLQIYRGRVNAYPADQAGICGSSGSACTSGSLDPSHVLLAIGLPHEIAHGSLRLTLSEKTTLEDIDYTVDKLKEIIARLRSMSPLYEDFVKKNGKSEA